MVKKILTAALIAAVLGFFGYHLLHYGAVITARDEAAMYQWRLNWADRK